MGQNTNDVLRIRRDLLKSINRPKLILCWSTVIEGNYANSHVFRTKAQTSTPFLGDRSWIFAGVFCKSPLSTRYRRVFFFSPIIWGVLRPKYAKQKQNEQISGGKKHTPFVNGLTGAHTYVEHVRNSSKSVPKTAWTSDSWTNLWDSTWTSVKYFFFLTEWAP